MVYPPDGDRLLVLQIVARFRGITGGPPSRGPLKQAVGVPPTEASETGLSHMKYGVALAIQTEKLNERLDKFVRSTAPERLVAESDVLWLGNKRITRVHEEQS